MITNFRNLIFWSSDWLKGSKIRKHHEAVTKINYDHNSKYAVDERKKYLYDLLKHCLETVPYYKNLNLKNTPLEGYPVTNKNIIRLSPNLFESEVYMNKKTFEVSTSGSTGTPFTVKHDLDKRKRHTADVRFYWEAVGHGFGTGFYYLRVWTNQNKKSKLVQKKNNFIPIDIRNMDDSSVADFLKKISTLNTPKSILGYSSAFDRIVKYLQQNPSNFSNEKIIAIVAMSEALDYPTKTALTNYFNCPVVSRYANTECGMLAQQTSELKDYFLLNLASYHIEVLHLKKDVPVAPGKVGRIVVTDLFNRAMPMIRYDTGDIGVLGIINYNGRTRYVLQRVEGRKMDTIYDTQSNPISSFTINNNMWKYSALQQYQFIQESPKTYVFKLNVTDKFSRKNELVDEFKGYLGKDAEIAIIYVNEIPLLSSGKRKKVMNTMKI